MMSIPGPFDAKVCAGDTCQLKTNVATNVCAAGKQPYSVQRTGPFTKETSAGGQ